VKTYRILCRCRKKIHFATLPIIITLLAAITLVLFLV